MKSKSGKKEIQEDKPSRASFHPRSTTQGGSDFGQGSSELGKESYQQGSLLNTGSNYENEADWNNEALRTSENANEKKAPPAEKRHTGKKK